MLASVLGQKCCCEPVKLNASANELSFSVQRDSKKVAPCHADEVCLSGVGSARAAVHKRPQPLSVPLLHDTVSEPTNAPKHAPSDSEPDRSAWEELQRDLRRTQEALHRELEEAQRQTMRYRQLNSLSHQAPRGLSLPTTNLVNSRENSRISLRHDPESDNSQVILLPHKVGAMMLRCEPILDPLFFLTIDYKSFMRIEALVSRLAGIPPGDCVDFEATLKARQENQQVMLVRKHPLHNTPFSEVAIIFGRKMTLIGLRTSSGIIGWAPPDSTRVQESDELLVVACTPYAFAAGLTKESYLSEMPNGMRNPAYDARFGSSLDEPAPVPSGLAMISPSHFPLPDLKNRRCCV